MSEHTKCMIPRPIKKGERLTIEGVEYVVTGIKKIDAPFYEATLEPNAADVAQEVEPVAVEPEPVVAEVQSETAKSEEAKAE